MLMRRHTGGTHTLDAGQLKWGYFRNKDILTNTTNLILPILMSSLPQVPAFFLLRDFIFAQLTFRLKIMLIVKRQLFVFAKICKPAEGDTGNVNLTSDGGGHGAAVCLLVPECSFKMV